MLQIRRSYNRLDGGHCDVTGHRKMPVLAEHGLCHDDNPWKWWTKIVLCSVKPIGNEQEWWDSHCGVLYKLNLIQNLGRISDW